MLKDKYACRLGIEKIEAAFGVLELSVVVSTE